MLGYGALGSFLIVVCNIANFISIFFFLASVFILFVPCLDKCQKLYDELQYIEYYITIEKIIYVTRDECIKDAIDCYDVLDLDMVYKIVVRPLKNKKNQLANIDFYIKTIEKELSMKHFEIRRDMDDIMDYKKGHKRGMQDKKKYRFYFVMNYTKLIEILSNLIPNSVSIKIKK